MKLMIKSAMLASVILIPSLVHAAYNTAGTDWSNSTEKTYTRAGPATDSLDMVNFLLCVTKATNMGKHVNKTYSAQIDEDICNGVKPGNVPQKAVAVVTTERASNTSDYNIKSWFTTAEGMYVVAKSVVKAAPTAANPRGVVDMTWNAVNGTGHAAPNGWTNIGGRLTTDANNNVSYHATEFDNGQPLLKYIHGNLTATTGNLRVQNQTWSGNTPTNVVYQYAFNSDLLHYQPVGGAAVCSDRTAGNMKKYTYDYRVFTEAGAAVSMTGPYDMVYQDSTNADQRGWVDHYGVWLQNGEDDSNSSDKARPTSFKRSSNGKTYSICYDTNDNGVSDAAGSSASCTGNSDGKRYLVTHASEAVPAFDTPLEFEGFDFTDSLSGVSVSKDAVWTRGGSYYARYDRVDSSLAMYWQCKVGNNYVDEDGAGNCDGSNNWRPKYVMPDGTQLTLRGGSTTYRIKGTYSEQTLAAGSGCSAVSALDLSPGTAAKSDYTVPNIASTVLWSDMPTVANGKLLAADVMKVIHGVDQ